jgi:drug/metabolite transporter (DMT)-like permease
LRKISLILGIVLLLAGVISEAMYITTSNVAYGNTVVSSAYLTLGIIFIIVGFIFTLSSAKIPKIHVS